MHHLAEVNIARLKSPLDSPDMREFVDNLQRINELAEQSPGFVWRLKDEAGDATSIVRPFGEDYIVNLSLWEDLESLRLFTYKSDHAPFIRRRKDWVADMNAAHLCLWHVDKGEIPTLQDARIRLEHFDQNGPTPFSFSFAKAFSAEGESLRKLRA